MDGVEGMKDSFILYTSFYEPLKLLTDEQLGRLFRAIFEFNINGSEEVSNDIKMAFAFIKNQLIVDSKKYENTLKRKSEAGKRGMKSRWSNSKENITEITNDNSVINDITKITEDNSVINDITKITKITDNDNDNDNENENVNDNVIKEKKIKKRKVFQKPTIEEIQQYCTDRNNNVDAECFYDFYESKGWKVGKEPMKDWKACVRTWEKNSTPVQRNEKNRSYQNYSQREYDDLSDFYDIGGK